MIRRVRQEVDPRFVEERRFSAIALRKNDFVEELDGGVVRAFALTLMNELIESCSMLVNRHQSQERAN